MEMSFSEYDRRGFKRYCFSRFRRSALGKQDAFTLIDGEDNGAFDNPMAGGLALDCHDVSEWATGKNGGWFARDCFGAWYAVGYENYGYEVVKIVPYVRTINDIETDLYFNFFRWVDAFTIEEVLKDGTTGKRYKVERNTQEWGTEYAYRTEQNGKRYYFGDADIMPSGKEWMGNIFCDYIGAMCEE